MVEIGRAHGMGMQFNASQVHNPSETRRPIDHKFLCSPTGRKRECHGAEPRRSINGRSLLIERLALGSIDEAFQYDGAILNSLQRAGRDRKVVTYEVKFGQL
jgi:hypothetical protein